MAESVTQPCPFCGEDTTMNCCRPTSSNPSDFMNMDGKYVAWAQCLDPKCRARGPMVAGDDRWDVREQANRAWNQCKPHGG